jgi:hypothetical protein
VPQGQLSGRGPRRKLQSTTPLRPRRLCVQRAAAQRELQVAHSLRGPRAADEPQLLSRAATTAAAQIRAPQKPCGCAAGAVQRAPQPHVNAMQRSGPHVTAQRARATLSKSTWREATAVRMIPTPRGARRSGTGDRAQQPLATGVREQRDATGPTAGACRSPQPHLARGYGTQRL